MVARSSHRRLVGRLVLDGPLCLHQPPHVMEVGTRMRMAVLGLAAMATDYITGTVLDVDGGLALGRYGIPVA